MHTLFIQIVLIICMILSSLMGAARAQIDLGISVGNQGLEGFYLAAGDYYRVPKKEVIIIKERQIPDEEIPVVLLIARAARVSPEAVIDLRLKGNTWMDITLHFGLGREIFCLPASPTTVYVPVIVDKGPPYGKAHGYYQKKPKKEWSRVVLRDIDVINLVNLKFTSEYYHLSPDEVIRMRQAGHSYPQISRKLREAGKGGAAPEAAAEERVRKGLKKDLPHGHKREMKSIGHKGKGRGRG
ncbi:MAG: hypothetical protein K6U11_09905 [bacterium]|nr:hypothetical protein [bacterium]